MNIRISSIPLMLQHMKSIYDGKDDFSFLEQVLQHEDYLFEMRRYGVQSPENLLFYFSNMKTISQGDIADFTVDRKDILRQRHPLWLDVMNHTDVYANKYDRLKKIWDDSFEEEMSVALQRAFPHKVDLTDAEIVSTMSIGSSFGYVFENALHVDLLGIGHYCSFDELPAVVLHELHHLEMLRYMGSYAAFTKDFSLAETYIFRFTGEGLAIKFCNNAQGIISKAIAKDKPANIGLDAFSMAALNGCFPEVFSLFRDTLTAIREGRMTQRQMEKQFRTYWWNPYLPVHKPGKAPKLKQTPIYSLGNELFGTIYDAFGLEGVFACVQKPLETPAYFNRALRSIGADPSFTLPE